MSAQEELAKAYSPKETDAKWMAFWEKSGFFKVNPLSGKPAYTIVLPPPNVTGHLHMGHAFNGTVQDTLIRFKRMCGFEVLWQAGVDHAGIATQTVVERMLMKTEGKRRKDYDRETFLKHVWAWKDKHEAHITSQFKLLGCSCDWSRTRFTMDEGCNLAVRKVFAKMFKEGLIYRGDYLVNWDPVTQTALADDEVEHEERASHFWHFSYPLEDGSGSITVATTRPETMLGDTAVAVNPKDERYAALIGKMLKLPLTGRLIPVIADPFVDMAFGTGAVKVTPAHDPNDYEMGIRHKLPLINIMTPDGRVNENGLAFCGLSFAEARDAVVKAMKDAGHLVKIEPHTLRVGISYRSKAIIEPYMSKQWFVKMDGFAKKLTEAVETGKLKLIPSNWESTWYNWTRNLRDWCISRQLWWGHRIPIWYRKSDPSIMVCADSDALPAEVAAAPHDWVQDEDVLDTWFSSALWPFSSIGWPNDKVMFERFYPNNVLVTGYDILFFWVARMALMGEYVMGQLPFSEVFLNGLIYGKSYWRQKGSEIHYVDQDERKAYDLGQPIPKDVYSKWEKLSKSKGNVIDPLELIDEYGTDAVRMALCASASQGRQVDLDRRRFEEYKNFTNKVWNGARFVLMNLTDVASGPIDTAHLHLEDRWILAKLSASCEKVRSALDRYAFDEAAMSAYDFFWNEFCAYYVEICKPVLFGKRGTDADRVNKQKVLLKVLDASLRLLHPMAPFITEELFQILKERFGFSEPSLCVAKYPEPAAFAQQDIDDFSTVCSLIYTIRNIRGEMKLAPGQKTDCYIVGADVRLAKAHSNIIEALVNLSNLHIGHTAPQLRFTSSQMQGELTVVIPMPESLLALERERLAKEEIKVREAREKTLAQLANEEFVAKAPAQLVAKLKAQLELQEAQLAAISQKLQA